MSPAPTKKKELGTDQGGGVISGGRASASQPALQIFETDSTSRRSSATSPTLAFAPSLSQWLDQQHVRLMTCVKSELF